MADTSTFEDQVEIEQLIYRYARAVDTRDAATLSEMFVPEAVMTAPEFVWRGDIGVNFRDMMSGEEMPPGAIPEGIGGHQMFTHHHTVDGDSARGTTYCIGYMGPRPGADPRLQVDYIRYADTLVRRNARWRFLRRDIDIRSFTQPIPALMISVGAGDEQEAHR